MRRLVLVLLLALLPLQWSWAAAGAACDHDSTPSTHFGHHAHEHTDATPEDSSDDANSGHHDCSVCQAMGVALMTQSALPQGLTPATGFAGYRDRVPDRVPEGLLRPPHRHAG